MELTPVQPDSVSVNDSEIPTMRLGIGQTQWTVPGAIVEGLWQLGSEHLIATTDDVPFEEGLHLCLLTADGTVDEEISVFSMYSTGTFELHGLSGPVLDFRFFDTPVWHLTVEPEKQLRLPFSGTLKGTRRKPIKLWSRLALHE